jgi:hypothetical protein
MMALMDALNLMDAADSSGKPLRFSIKFVKKSTGEIISIPDACKPSGPAGTSAKGGRAAKAPASRNPSHFKNQTRNVRVFGTEQIRKVCIRLILEVNGHKIFY